MAHVKVTQLSFHGNIFTSECFGCAASQRPQKELGLMALGVQEPHIFTTIVLEDIAFVEQNA